MFFPTRLTMDEWGNLVERIKCPILIVTGGLSSMTTYVTSYSAFFLAVLPTSTFQVVEKGGHWCHQEFPLLWIDLLSNFIPSNQIELDLITSAKL